MTLRVTGSVDPVVTPGRKAALGLYLFERFPSLRAAMTERFVDLSQ